MSDIALENPGAAAPSSHSLLLSVLHNLLGWTAGMALRLLMLLAVIALVRSPPGELH